jgi:hypothetical protein
MRVRAPGVPRAVAVLRVLLFVFPCAALAMALPEVPHWFVVTAVVLCAALWARQPDHLAGGVGLVLVLGWWSTRGLVDWRVLVVGVLVVSAHVVATVLAHGPPTLALDRRLARLWLGRGLLALVPMPVTWLAVRGLDPGLAPGWLWVTAAAVTVALLVAASRLTQPEPS